MNFSITLVMELLKPQIMKKVVILNLQKIIQTKAAYITYIEENYMKEKLGRTGSIYNMRRAICSKCPRTNNHKIRNYCEGCNCWMCSLHFFEICNDCKIVIKRIHKNY